MNATPKPPTLHDFRGFDPALETIEYPAPGAPELARQIVGLLAAAGWTAEADADRGLDHGAWVPLLHLLPEADIPVVQVSLPRNLTGEDALALGRALSPLAVRQVLVVGSGSLTHNLHEVFNGSDEVGYAQEFVRWIHAAVRSADRDRLVRALEIAPHARRAHPTPEHYWPLLVAAGAGRLDAAQIIEGGMRYRVLCMDAFVFGQ